MNLLTDDFVDEGYSPEVAQLQIIQQLIAQEGEEVSDYEVLEQIISSLELNGFVNKL